MYRCFAIASAAMCLHSAALAQVQRSFPANALRGDIRVISPPDIELNGAASRLAPGARIRGRDNMLQMSGSLVGEKMRVNYTLDTYGLVRDVWILRPEEAKVRPWPRTSSEAQTWTFDPAAQTWSKP